MNFEGYLAARETAQAIGDPLVLYALIVAVGFAVAYIMGREDYAHHLLRVEAALLTIGFLVLAWFHLQIYQNIVIIDPLTSGELGRFAVPLWIEGEKLYFWALLLALFMLLGGPTTREFDVAASMGLASMVGLAWLSKPFSPPLPRFHEEVLYYFSNPNNVQVAGQMMGRLTYYYNTWYMWTHPPMLFVAYASLVLTFLACIIVLLRGDPYYDEIAYRYAKIGYVFLTIGMLVGYPWAVIAWEGPWWWDPKINASILMWVLYTAYLHTRLYRRLWRQSAILGIFCFASLVFTYLMTYVVPGIHSYR